MLMCTRRGEHQDQDLCLTCKALARAGAGKVKLEAQLSWLASQPHLHKVVIAGNYDILFDQRFLDSHREQFPVLPKQTREFLNWGDIIYLENSGTTLTFPFHQDRKLKIYGSPLTPKSLDSAFQYLRDHGAWEGQDRSDIDILVTHGPAWGHWTATCVMVVNSLLTRYLIGDRASTYSDIYMLGMVEKSSGMMLLGETFKVSNADGQAGRLSLARQPLSRGLMYDATCCTGGISSPNMLMPLSLMKAIDSSTKLWWRTCKLEL